ncbi:MAG: N-acetylmuramoyl-L-alanine amidase [Verrucomicrobiota bacterium]
MNPSSASIFLTLLLQSSLLVAGAWILISLLRKTSAARISTACRFTMAAALALVAVTIGSTAFSLIQDAKPISFPATLPQGAGSIMESALLNSSESPSAEKPSSSPAGRATANPSSAGPLKLPAVHARWLGAAWLTGAALVLTAWVSSLAARLTLLRRSENAAGLPWLDIASDVKGWSLVHQVRLIPQGITPCVWGVWKTVLALPASAESWPTTKLKLVLAHECAHLLRRDPLWQILSRFFLALLWFHPLAWSIARRSQAADEQAADDTVLRAEGDGPAYADLLVECARQFSLRPALQTAASAMASPSSLTRRVEAVLNPAADRRTAGAGHLAGWAAILSLMTAAVCLASPQIEAGPAASEKQEAASGLLVPAPVPDSQAPSPLFEPPIDPSAPRPSGPSKEAPPAGTSEEAKPATSETTDTSATESAPEATPATPSFNWQPVSRNGLDYLPASQIKAFYQFPRFINEESGNFQLRSNTMIIKGTTGSNEMFINNVKFILKHPALPSEGGPLISRHDLSLILDPIIRPTYIKGPGQVTTVVIDPGHGGNDSGAIGPQGKESAYTLDTAQRLREKLVNAGFKVILTREDDRFLPLQERADFAAAQPEAILISLHFHSGPSSQRGIQTFFPEENPDSSGQAENPAASGHFRACVALAAAVHANCLYKLRSTDGGIRSAKFSMISGQTNVPAILIDGGYLSHPEEAGRIGTESYRQTLAEAIAKGVQNYIRARSKRTPLAR